MDKELLNRLGLDVEVIERDMEVSYRLGRIYYDIRFETSNQVEQDEKPPDHNQLLISASYFRRAGAHALLLGNKTLANESFFYATGIYDWLSIPYGALIVALSSYQTDHLHHVKDFLVDFNKNRVGLGKSSRRQQVYNLLTYAVAHENLGDLAEEARIIRRDLETYRAFPMGVLGIPLTYLT